MGEKSKSSFVVKIIAAVLVLGVAVFFVKSLFSSDKNSVTGNAVQELSQSIPLEAQMVNGVQQVTLSWGKLNYNPQEIVVKKDIPVKITADLDRLRGCFRSFNIKEFGVSKQFNEKDASVEFTPNKVGDFHFSCAMGMGDGTLHVK